jgi:heme exporter protein B
MMAADPDDGSLGGDLRAVGTVAWKDFRLELRSKQALPMAAALALLIVVVFAFSFGGARNAAGALWVAFVFAGTLGVLQSVAVEGENDAFDALLLAPIPNSAIYVGKVLSATAFVAAIGLFTLGATRVFLQSTPGAAPPMLIGTVVLFAFGFAAVSVIVSAITLFTRISDLLLPVLLVPLLIPALLAGVELTGSGGASGNWLTVIASYDGIVFISGLLVFEELVT